MRTPGHLEPHDHPGLRRRAPPSPPAGRDARRSPLAGVAGCPRRRAGHHRGARGAPRVARRRRRTAGPCACTSRGSRPPPPRWSPSSPSTVRPAPGFASRRRPAPTAFLRADVAIATVCTQNRWMRIAFGTDEQTALTDGLRARLAEAGHEVVDCGDGDPVARRGPGGGGGGGGRPGRSRRGVLLDRHRRVDRGEQGGAACAPRSARTPRRHAARAGGTTRTSSRSACGSPRGTVADEVVDAFLTTDVDPSEREVIDRLS